jgi:hypothetical protein
VTGVGDLPTPRILYIGGTGRTGSTTLDQLAGQAPGWFSGGELAYLWSLGLGEGGLCSCGVPVAECGVWSAVLGELADDPVRLAADMTAARQRFRSVHLPLMLLPRFTRQRLRSLRDYLGTLELLYRHVAEHTGAGVIVDSSKEPHYSMLLRDGTSLPVTFVHLVRDPRAVAYSWQRRKAERGLAGGRTMEHRGPLLATVFSTVSNVAAEVLWWRHRDRYAFLRYEDLVADPDAVLDALGQLVGEAPGTVGLPAGMRIDLARTHTAWGNPDRIGRTQVTVREDTAWRTGLGRGRAVLLTVLNLPLLVRYGYPLRPRAAPRRGPRSRRLAAANLAVPDVTGRRPGTTA